MKIPCESLCKKKKGKISKSLLSSFETKSRGNFCCNSASLWRDLRYNDTINIFCNFFSSLSFSKDFVFKDSPMFQDQSRREELQKHVSRLISPYHGETYVGPSRKNSREAIAKKEQRNTCSLRNGDNRNCFPISGRSVWPPVPTFSSRSTVDDRTSFHETRFIVLCEKKRGKKENLWQSREPKLDYLENVSKAGRIRLELAISELEEWDNWRRREKVENIKFLRPFEPR